MGIPLSQAEERTYTRIGHTSLMSSAAYHKGGSFLTQAGPRGRLAAMAQLYAVYFEAGGKAQYVTGKGGKVTAFDRDGAHAAHADAQAKNLSSALIVDYADVPTALRVKGG